VILELRNVHAGYGKITILHGVSLTAGRGEIITVIGPNGAGKSTLMKAVAGHLPTTEGEVRLDGVRIDGSGASKAAAAGVGYVPQERNVFEELSVIENLRVTANAVRDATDTIDATFERFPFLAERGNQRADTLSGGERQILAISAALAGRPRVLLLDEPTSGLAPIFVQNIVDWISEVAEEGTAVVWVVEQSPEAILRISDRTYVMDGGQISREIPSSELLDPEELRKVFLGDQREGRQNGA
jgi:branched-chain amino acid transport system ATP-binding protein